MRYAVIVNICFSGQFLLEDSRLMEAAEMAKKAAELDNTEFDVVFNAAHMLRSFYFIVFSIINILLHKINKFNMHTVFPEWKQKITRHFSASCLYTLYTSCFLKLWLDLITLMKTTHTGILCQFCHYFFSHFYWGCTESNAYIAQKVITTSFHSLYI